MKFLHIGYSNYTNVDKIHGISKPNAAPIRRQIATASDKGTLIDCTMGRKTLSVIFTDEYIILSAVKTETLVERYEKNVT